MSTLRNRKGDQVKPKLTERQRTIQLRVESNGLENRKTIQKTNKTKTCFQEEK